MYRIIYDNKALKDLPKLKAAKLNLKLKELVAILEVNPFQNPPPYEKLKLNLNGFYSRRLNIQHRLVYMVDEEQKVVKILSFWSHYERL